MSKIIKIILICIYVLVGLVLIPWGIQSGWQVFQKYRPRFLPFTGSGTVIDENTKQGIPGVYVLLKATGYRQFKSLDFAPEGSRNSGNWYSGLCETLHVAKTDANGHYSYSVSPGKAFTYPWPYSAGFYLEYYDSNYFYVWDEEASDKRNQVTELKKQVAEVNRAQSYFTHKLLPSCASYADKSGELRRLLTILVANKFKYVCRNQDWNAESIQGQPDRFIARPYTQTSVYGHLLEIAGELDQINAQANEVPKELGPIQEAWKRTATQFLGDNLISQRDDTRLATDGQVQTACAYFSTNFLNKE
jgi:hypothetical protein